MRMIDTVFRLYGLFMLLIGVFMYGLTAFFCVMFNIDILYITEPIGVFFMIGVLLGLVGAVLLLLEPIIKKVVLR